MHEERIRKWSKQEKKMPDGGVTAMEEEIKVFFWGGGGVGISALFKSANLCQTRLNPRPTKKTLKHL